MRRTWIAAAVFVLSGAVVLAQGGAAAAPDRSADDAAIKKLAADFEIAYNAGDAKGAAAIYAVDADTVTFVGRLVKGRAAIEKAMAEDLAGPSKGGKTTITVESIRYYGSTMAIVDGRVTMTPAGAGEPLKGMYTVIAVKRKAGWIVLASRDYVPIPGPAASKKTTP